MSARRCAAKSERGEPCAATPLRAREFCFWHDPDSRHEAQEARRLGGLRRRREGAVAGAYEFAGLASVEDLRRLLEIAALDALGLDNSIPRVRALVSVVGMGAKLLETGELAERVAALEAGLAGDAA